jgi:protein TonB
MVSQQDRLFYASGALSFGIFLLTLFLFASVLFSYDAVKNFALSKEDYVAVSLVSVPLQERPTKAKKEPAPAEEPLPVKEPEPQTEEELITTPEAFKDASALFENVWTQEVSTKKRPVKKPVTDSKRISAIEKRIKTAQKNKQQRAAEKIASVKLAKPSVSVQGSASSASSEVNEYYAKIQAIVYNHFNPPVNSEGNSAKVYLRLDADGRIKAARLLVPSGQPLFDNEVEALLRRLGSAVFPSSPEGRPIELKIILTAEE